MQRCPECLIQTIGYADSHIAGCIGQALYIVVDTEQHLWWKFHNVLQILRLALQDIVLYQMPYKLL